MKGTELRRLTLALWGFLQLTTLSTSVLVAQDQLLKESRLEQIRTLNRELINRSEQRLDMNSAQLRQLLDARREIWTALASAHPSEVKQLALPQGTVQEINQIVAGAEGLMEQSGEWRGVVELVSEDDFKNGTSRTRMFLRVGDETVEVFSEEELAGSQCGSALRVRGLRLGGMIAAEEIFILRNSSGSACQTTGEQRVAVIMAEFPGDPLPGYVTKPYLESMFFTVPGMSLNDYWREASRDQIWTTGDVYGPFTLSQSYTCSAAGSLRTAAIAAADSAIDFSQYDRVFLIVPPSANCGLGSVGCSLLSAPQDGDFQASFTWISTEPSPADDYLLCVVAHEGGHNLGLRHASSLAFDGVPLGSIGTPGSHSEYGDRFSMMGVCYSYAGQEYLGHYTSKHKHQLGWFTPQNLTTVESSGTFSLKPYSNAGDDLKSLRVRRGFGIDRWLWLEYRQPSGYDATFSGPGTQVYDGVMVHYEDPTSASYAEYPRLLDFTANTTPGNFADPALAEGTGWTDPYTELSLSVGGATAESLEVSINYDIPCAMIAPTGGTFPPGGGMGSVVVTASGNCEWSAVSNDAWITVSSGGAGAGSGLVEYSISPNSLPNQRQGSISIGRQAFPVVQTSLNAPPMPTIAVPSHGASLVEEPRQFHFSFSDADGASTLDLVSVLFNSTSATTNACFLEYDPGANQLRLWSDSGSSWSSWNPGANRTLSNSQCLLNILHSSATASGSTLDLVVELEFRSASTGRRNVYLAASDSSGGASGWMEIGQWSVYEDGFPNSPGAYSSGWWVLDANGNFTWDGTEIDRRVFFSLGAGEVPVTGDWNGSGTTKIGVYRDGTWLLDFNGNGVFDGAGTDKLLYFGAPGYEPYVGDWDGTGTSKIAVHHDGTWLIDYNGNFQWDGAVTDRLLYFGGPGYEPYIGDWDGSGTSKIAVHQSGTWIVDYNGNFQWDGAVTDRLLYFGGPGYTPVTGDWNGDAATDLAAYQDGTWVVDFNGNFAWDGIATDKLVYFGGPGYIPMSGDWDGTGPDKVGAYLDGLWVLDVNGNYAWDTPPTDQVIFFGGPGQTPVVGAW